MISTADSPPDSANGGTGRRHPRDRRRNAQEEEQDEDDDEQEEEKYEEGSEEESQQDCFFESFDRVYSRTSFVVDVSSESDDEDEDEDVDNDVRFSFASAVPPSSDFRCVTFSREKFLVERPEDSDKEGGKFQHGRSSEYDIWMAEPTSISERRQRLLLDMGFASSKDLAAVLRTCSRKAVVPPPAAADVSASKPPPAPEVASPSSSSCHQTKISRCHSNKELATAQCSPKNPAEPDLPRSKSAPPALCNLPDLQRPGPTDGGGIAAAEEGEGLGVSSRESFRIKNLDTGKEFVFSELSKEGDWELSNIQNGNQISMGELEEVVGCSPIVKELMQRVNYNGDGCEQQSSDKLVQFFSNTRSSKPVSKKKGGWLKNFKFVASSVAGLIAEKEKGEKSSGDSFSELMKVRQSGKSYKDLTGLYMSQEIHAHEGSIWCIKFSWDGRYLASAGEDRVICVWQAQDSDVLSTPMPGQEAQTFSKSASSDRFSLLRTLPSKRSKKIKSRRQSMTDCIVMPEVTFSLSKKPICSLEGHSGDVLDLSWSKSQHLLSASMDKTVRLWDIESKTCLKLFAHNDYVTSIQFNPVDDRYFISGSLDSKVRIWSIPERHVVDWSDIHEMITAVSYTPDGQGVLVGSQKGNFRLYKTSECKLTQRGQIRLRKKKKPHPKKITGFQFAPGNPSEVLITSADSRIRVFDGLKLVHKFRAFRNTSSQISASYTSDGKFIVCASEDSNVYVWKREPTGAMSSGNKSKGWATTRAHECFYCKDVSVAIPWPSAGSSCTPLSIPDLSGRFDQAGSQRFTDSQRSAASLDDVLHSKRDPLPPLPKKSLTEQELPEELEDICNSSSTMGSDSFSSDSASLRYGATPTSISDSGALPSSNASGRWYSGASTRTSSADPLGAWGLVVVTAGLDGDIRIYQNFGLPLRLSPNLF